jgi:hypothetical protein
MSRKKRVAQGRTSYLWSYGSDDLKGKWVFLGNILIETGQIVITDPVHIDAQLPGIENPDIYSESCEASRPYGSILYGSGLALACGLSDGEYPVFGFFAPAPDGKGDVISRVVIDLACGGLSDEPGSEMDPLKAWVDQE